MSTYTPDRWVVIELNSPTTASIRKVFAGVYGGYCGSDSWKVSSGITQVTEHEDRYEFLNESGSLYVCYKHAYGMSGYMSSIYAGWERGMSDTITVKVVEGYNEKH
jgi:hypothetical protein